MRRRFVRDGGSRDPQAMVDACVVIHATVRWIPPATDAVRVGKNGARGPQKISVSTSQANDSFDTLDRRLPRSWQNWIIRHDVMLLDEFNTSFNDELFFALLWLCCTNMGQHSRLKTLSDPRTNASTWCIQQKMGPLSRVGGVTCPLACDATQAPFL